MGSKLLYLVALLAVALVVFAVVNQMGDGPATDPGVPVSAPDDDEPPFVAPPPLDDDEPEDLTPTPAGDADLIVRVFSESGEPVAGATVTTAVRGVPAARREERTDVEGTARFFGLPGGKRVSVQATGGLMDIPETKTANLSDVEPAEVRLVLTGGGAVAGTVFGAGGSPIPTAFKVGLERSRGASASSGITRHIRSGASAGKSFPAGTGTFSLPGVRPGTYVVSASAEGHTRAVSEPFEVRKGAVTDGIQVFLDACGRISGVVVRAATGEPVAGAAVNAFGDSGVPGVRAMAFRSRGGLTVVGRPNSDETDDAGRFSIDGLEPGEYEVIASAKDLSDGLIEVVTVDKGRETGGLRIEMGDGGTLTGTVYGPDGRPEPGAEVIVSKVVANMRIFGSMGDRVKANDRGVYLMEHLTPGRYSVRRAPAGNGSSMAVSIVMSGSNAREEEEEKPEAEDEVTIREGQVSRKDLRTGSVAGIRGVVRNEAGEPVRSRVELKLLKSAKEDESDPMARIGLEMPRFANSNEKGEFEFSGLEPGTWRVSAPGFAQELVLAEGQSREIEVRLRPSRIEGVVLDGNGRPIAGVRVRAMPARGRGMASVFSAMDSVKTGADGKFSLTGMSPGTYRIRANGKAGEGRSEEVILGSGETRRDIRVVIEQKVTVTVTVRNSAGEPVAGVWVFLQSDSVVGGSGNTNASGVATLSTLPGSYTLTVAVRGESPHTMERDVIIRPGSPESFEFRLD